MSAPGETRCLVLAPADPFPPRDAVAMRVGALVAQLPGEVDLLVFSGEARETTLPPPYRGRMRAVPYPSAPRLRPVMQSLVGAPTLIRGFRSDPFAAAVREALARKPGLVLAVGLQMAQYLPLIPGGIPRILDDYNVEWRILARLAELRRGLRRAYWRREAAKLRRWEGRLLALADRVTAVSDIDRQALLELVPGKEVRVVGPSVAADPQGTPHGHEAAGAPVFVFTGAFGWHVNIDAALWLCGEVLPHLREHLGDPRIHLVGKEPAPEVVALGALPGVTVTGMVPDVRTHLRAATCAVVPLRYGSGVRYKILEAFAEGTPVVSTSVGCEGLGVESGRHLLVADRPEEFARACAAVARDPDLRERLARDGFGFVRQANESAAAAFRGLVEETLARRASLPPSPVAIRHGDAA